MFNCCFSGRNSEQKQLRRLNARTGIDAGLLTVRTGHDDLHDPTTFTTSPRVDEFFNLVYNTSMDETALRLESYNLSGVHGELYF